MEFHEFLKDLRELKGIKQKDVAKSLDISAVAYNRFEKGNRLPDIYMLKRIADFFDVEMSYFISDDYISNEISLLRVSTRRYIREYKELLELTSKLEKILHDPITDKRAKYIVIEDLKDCYSRLLKEKVDIERIIELEPYHMFFERTFSENIEYKKDD